MSTTDPHQSDLSTEQWLKKLREEAKAYDMAKKKAERQKELDKLKQQREEELAKKKAVEEAKAKEKAMVRSYDVVYCTHSCD